MTPPNTNILDHALILALIIIAVFIFGCDNPINQSDSILYLIDGSVINSLTQSPLDSVKVTSLRKDYQPISSITDSTGYFIFSPFGIFRSSIEVELLFEKSGYISKDTIITIQRRGEIIDSLIIYLSHE